MTNTARILLFLVTQILCVLTRVSGQELSEEVRADVNKRMNTQRNWGERANSPGAELAAKEIIRTRETGKLFVGYDLYAKGMPDGLNYELYVLPTMASGPEQLQISGGDVTIDKDGRIIDGPDDPRRIFIPDPAPGEAFRFVLLSKNGKYKALLSIIPNVLEGQDKGCRIDVVRLMPKFELAFVQGVGFPPDSEVEFRSDSLGEIHSGKLKTNAAGYVDTGILPFVKNKSDGKAEVQIFSPKCGPKVSFHWGTTHE